MVYQTHRNPGTVTRHRAPSSHQALQDEDGFIGFGESGGGLMGCVFDCVGLFHHQVHQRQQHARNHERDVDNQHRIQRFF